LHDHAVEAWGNAEKQAGGLALGLHCVRVGISDPGKDAERMRKIVPPILLLLLAVVHAPRQAQALVSSFFPDIFPLATSEPVMLLLTGLALISLASVGSNRPR
jgi:hypothetical protein